MVVYTGPTQPSYFGPFNIQVFDAENSEQCPNRSRFISPRFMARTVLISAIFFYWPLAPSLIVIILDQKCLLYAKLIST